jgi:hypothetical protein
MNVVIRKNITCNIKGVVKDGPTKGKVLEYNNTKISHESIAYMHWRGREMYLLFIEVPAGHGMTRCYNVCLEDIDEIIYEVENSQ